MKNRILITGASGLIGTELSRFLTSINYEVIHLSRNKSSNNFKTFIWDIKKGLIQDGALNNIDCIIHLSGAGIADKRWRKNRKYEIINSRVNSTQLLFDSLKKLERKPKTFISASAVGFYPSQQSKIIYKENDTASNNFLGKVCKLWEESTNKISELGIRTIQLRLGVVLSKQGGALSKMISPFKYGLGSALGSGKQYLQWIHIEDFLNIISMMLEKQKMVGPYNLVAPTFTTNLEFSKTIAQILNKPFILPNVPSFILQSILGEMSQMILEGNKISSQKLIDEGYVFKYKDLSKALQDLLK